MAAASGPRAFIARLVSGLRKQAVRGEPLLYAAFAGACTLYVACLFYGSLRLQTLYSRLWLDPASLEHAPRLIGDWSAPLDDVFIHFDFARATARGHPFQWSEGNGYSSGGTSLLYPFVLAFGYWIGLRKLELVVWAGTVACTSTFALLLSSRRLFTNLPAFTSYLAPAALLSVGVLGWNLFSGMEVALLLGLWGGALLSWDNLVRKSAEPMAGTRSIGLSALSLGAWGALLVLTRPEAMTTVAVFSVSLAFVVGRHMGKRRALSALLSSAAPGALCVVLHSVANYVYTGDAAAAGALTKLELYDPFLTASEVSSEWWGNFRYQFERLSNYHLAAEGPYGWLPWILAVVALVPRATRRFAALLWATALVWIVFVALNGQVRWQNERYTMPALAWILLAAALGIGALLTQVRALGRRALVLRTAAAATALGAVGVFSWHEHPRFVEQVWFFGRASRNILDQHLRAGWLLRTQVKPRRVLLGDAGAIPYMSDLPALDLIGLGGYHRLPFARASQLGVGAAIELIEHMPANDRPDVLAIYPHWWGELPLWFGERIPDGSVSVRGNVICAGQSKVLYRADWAPLEGSDRPLSLEDGERVVDALDVGDLLSERAHRYTLSKQQTGHVTMKLLSHPRKPRARLWDAGRIIEPGASERFELSGFSEHRPVRLLFRVAPAQPTAMLVTIDGEPIGELTLSSEDDWNEKALNVPTERVRPRIEVDLRTLRGERILYHLFAVEGR